MQYAGYRRRSTGCVIVITTGSRPDLLIFLLHTNTSLLFPLLVINSKVFSNCIYLICFERSFFSPVRASISGTGSIFSLLFSNRGTIGLGFEQQL